MTPLSVRTLLHAKQAEEEGRESSSSLTEKAAVCVMMSAAAAGSQIAATAKARKGATDGGEEEVDDAGSERAWHSVSWYDERRRQSNISLRFRFSSTGTRSILARTIIANL